MASVCASKPGEGSPPGSEFFGTRKTTLECDYTREKRRNDSTK